MMFEFYHNQRSHYRGEGQVEAYEKRDKPVLLLDH